MDQDTENLDSSNEEQETDNSSNVEDEQDAEQDADKPEYTEREKQYYARIKKLEQELKDAKTATNKAPELTATGNLSPVDIIALMNAKVTEPEDIKEVQDIAERPKISIPAALKLPITKATLAELAEIRTSANAVSTGAGRRAGSGVISDDRLIADARKGILPESETDMARLQELRLKGRK